jgi:hypothetical protein
MIEYTFNLSENDLFYKFGEFLGKWSINRILRGITGIWGIPGKKEINGIWSRGKYSCMKSIILPVRYL